MVLTLPKFRIIWPKFITGIFFGLNLVWFTTSVYSDLWPIRPSLFLPSLSLESLFRYQPPLIPQTKSDTGSPGLTTQNYILVDLSTNQILLSRNPDQRIFPASITKLATALTALNIYPLDEVITVTEEYQNGKTMELRPEEKITVRSLVSALLVYSANDAAYNLAVHHPEGISGFVRQMNLITRKYDLKNTLFQNYDGIHDQNHYSTVYDLAQLGRLSVKNPIVSEVVKTKELTVADIDNQIFHPLQSTNELLEVIPEIQGLKTGWTPEAGGCFIGLIDLNGHQLISVVAQSQDRFADTKTIVQWAKDNLYWRNYQP